VKTLLQTTEIQAVNELFLYIDALITLERAPNSNIQLNENQTQSLRKVMSRYKLKRNYSHIAQKNMLKFSNYIAIILDKDDKTNFITI
jgi:low affinity Fe/Cu permease